MDPKQRLREGAWPSPCMCWLLCGRDAAACISRWRVGAEVPSSPPCQMLLGAVAVSSVSRRLSLHQ